MSRYAWHAEAAVTSMTNVAQSDVAQTPFLWARGVAARATLSYLDRHGIDAEPLLVKAELSRDQLTQNPGGISVTSQHLLELAAIETNDPLLGLHVAAEMELRDIGILFYLAASWRRMPASCSRRGAARADCGVWWKTSSVACFPAAMCKSPRSPSNSA
jgi:hypothetical protein